ncbi:hypothetical protein ACFX14_013475 [Malus domestica]
MDKYQGDQDRIVFTGKRPVKSDILKEQPLLPEDERRVSTNSSPAAVIIGPSGYVIEQPKSPDVSGSRSTPYLLNLYSSQEQLQELPKNYRKLVRMASCRNKFNKKMASCLNKSTRTMALCINKSTRKWLRALTKMTSCLNKLTEYWLRAPRNIVKTQNKSQLRKETNHPRIAEMKD